MATKIGFRCQIDNITHTGIINYLNINCSVISLNRKTVSWRSCHWTWYNDWKPGNSDIFRIELSLSKLIFHSIYPQCNYLSLFMFLNFVGNHINVHGCITLFFFLQIPLYKYIWVMISCKNTPSVFSTVKFLLQMFCLQNTWLVKPAVLLTNQFKAPL